MFAEAANFGIKAVMGIGKGILAEAEANAFNRVSEANAAASNLIRTANNKLKGARGSLARYNQSVNNQRVLENTGSAAEAAAINYRRARDSTINDDLESQIAFAEQAGAQAAASALSGLSGGVADIVAGTTALRKARIQQRTDEALKGMDYDAAQRNKQIMQAGWDSLDHSEITEDLDYSTNVAQVKRSGGNLLTDIFGGQDAKTMANLTSQGAQFFKRSALVDSVNIPMQPGGGY